jgi:hypothetical protein
MKSLILFILCLSPIAHAVSLSCQISLNMQVIHQVEIQSLLNEKVAIGRKDGISAYVTEKQDHSFLIEAFLADEEARIYAQGSLNTANENLLATFWNRDHMIDVGCHLRQP